MLPSRGLSRTLLMRSWLATRMSDVAYFTEYIRHRSRQPLSSYLAGKLIAVAGVPATKAAADDCLGRKGTGQALQIPSLEGSGLLRSYKQHVCMLA